MFDMKLLKTKKKKLIFLTPIDKLETQLNQYLFMLVKIKLCVMFVYRYHS